MLTRLVPRYIKSCECVFSLPHFPFLSFSLGLSRLGGMVCTELCTQYLQYFSGNLSFNQNAFVIASPEDVG